MAHMTSLSCLKLARNGKTESRTNNISRFSHNFIRSGIYLHDIRPRADSLDEKHCYRTRSAACRRRLSCVSTMPISAQSAILSSNKLARPVTHAFADHARNLVNMRLRLWSLAHRCADGRSCGRQPWPRSTSQDHAPPVQAGRRNERCTWTRAPCNDR